MAKGFFGRCQSGLTQVGTFLGHLFLLIIRLYWGGALFLIGIEKFMTLDKVTEFFGSVGIPFPFFSALLVATVETLGGISLFIGLFSRLFSFLLIILFWVAYVTVHTEAVLNIFTNPSAFFAQNPFLFLYAAIIIFCFGTGFASFDYWLEKKRS